MYFYLKVFNKQRKDIDAKLIVADDKKSAEEQAKKFISHLVDNDETRIKREGINHELIFVSQEQHEENIREIQEEQDTNPEIKAAALILSGGKHTPEKELNYEQTKDAAMLVLESSVFDKNYADAYGLLMMHLSIECEVDDDGEDDYYEDIPEEEMAERQLSRMESVYWGCDEHYTFPTALEGDVWQ